MSQGWTIQFVMDWDEIYSSSFQAKWLQLAENGINSNVFFHPALCMAWIKTYKPLRNLTPLFCSGNNNGTSVFLPLVLWRQNWKNACRKVIVPVGYSDFDYHYPLTKGAIKPRGLSDFYRTLLHNLEQLVDYDSLDINGLIAESNLAAWKEELDIAPVTDLTSYGDTEDLLKSLKSSLRGDIRRQIKRSSVLGPIALYEYDMTDEALEVLPQFLRLHSNRWPKAYKAPEFHKNIIINTINKGLLHFSSLKAGDKILSYHLGFTFTERYYYYMPVIDPEFENLSPGKIHLFKLMEYAINNGFTVFDHLRGDENYKTGWTSNAQKLYRMSIHNEQLLSRIKNGICHLKAKLA